MSVNSRTKGAAGEREWSAYLNEHFGLHARRGQQRSGLDQADVIDGIPGTHVEVKRVEALNIHKAIDQATRDAPPHLAPYVAHRRNRGPWLVTLRADDLVRFALAVCEAAGRRWR